MKSRKLGPGNRQQRWDDGPLAMHEREAQRRRRVQALLRGRAERYRQTIHSMVGKANGHGSASGKAGP